MKKRDFFARYGAYIVALTVFVALSCIYCAPSLTGKIVQAGDVVSGNAAAHESVQYRQETGENTFWTGSMFSGMPNYQTGGYVYESARWMKPVRKLLKAPAVQHTHLALLSYFICFFILLRSFKVGKWTSIAGALAIGLSSYFLLIIPAGHFFKVSTIPLMSVTVAGFMFIYQGRYGLGAVLTMLFTAVGFIDHPQMSYYLCLLIGVLFLAQLWLFAHEKRMKQFLTASLIFAASFLVGLGTNSASLFANREYAEQTMRGGHSDLVKASDADNRTEKGLDIDYATQWSYGIGESMTFLIPGFQGNASGYDIGTDSELYQMLVRKGVDKGSAAQFCSQVPLYWGDQPFTSGAVYMGAVVCFLFLLGLFVVKGPFKWALLAATLFSVMLAWGRNFMPLSELFFFHFPLYNKFRAVSSILIVAEITMPLLGFMALKELFEETADRKRLLAYVYVSAGITALICLVMALFGGSMFDFKSPHDGVYASHLPAFVYHGILAERQHLLVSDSWRSFFFILLAAAVLWLYLKGVLKKGWCIALIGVLTVADLWPVDKRFFNDDNYVTPRQHKAQFAMLPYEKQILADPDPHFRVYNLTTNSFNEARTSYYLKHIGGYSAAKLRRYQDLIDEHISKMNRNVIDMLNTKYYIVKGSDGQPQPLLNPDALGNAWFVDSLVVVDNANAESDALRTLPLARTAVLDRSFASYTEGFVPGHDEVAEVKLTAYTPRALDYVCRASKEGIVVFSEIYYPYGWKASIDGQRTDHFRVDYMLRALRVPAGEHVIHFEFDPDSVKKGNALSMTCVILLYGTLLTVVGLWVFSLIKKRKQTA